MGQFVSPKITTIQKRIGESVSLPCQVPLGYPPPVVTWQTSKDAQLDYIKETSRLAIDVDGTLHIAAILSTDDGVTFQCVANNEIIREQTTGPGYKITARYPEINQPITFLYQTPYTSLAVVNETLRLQCILGGYPLPSYRWYKDGKDATLSPNTNIVNMGTTLEINPVTNATAGQYRCQGVNEATMTSMNYEYEVRVKSAPKFTIFPVDTMVPENGSVVFTCEAEADPRPKVRWTVNGLDPSFYLDGVRKLISGNTMILNNLTVDDNAVIQCNASNSFGYDFVNAFINVLREPPYIYKAPPKNLRQTEGAMVLLPCRSYSAPRALVAWRKDGRPINGGRYQVMENGDLIIESGAVTDTGMYECTATNPFGVTKAAGSLAVRRRTRVTLAPIETWVYEGQLVKFVCTADTDPEEVANMGVTWYKDNNVIDPRLTPRIEQIGFDYSLVIGGAQTLDTGQYRCNASNGLDFATATASLLVQGRPNQPRNLVEDCITFAPSRRAMLKWAPGSDNYAPIIEYIVEFSTQFERKTWYRAEIYNLTGLLQATDAKIVLRPNIDYQFRVRTRNRVGLSEPSVATTGTCSIAATAPDSNPKELYVYGTASNNLVIQWSTMPYIEHYANNLVYLLTVRCLNCNNIRPGDINTTIISDWRTDRITYTMFQSGDPSSRIMQPIESYKLFEVTIQSRNDKGTSTKAPTVARGYSGENMPSIAASALTVVQPTSDGAVLQWTIIFQNQEPLVNGFFRGYRIEWCNATLNQVECERQKRFQDVLFQRLLTPTSYMRRPRSVSENHEEGQEESEISSLVHFFYSPPSELSPTLSITERLSDVDESFCRFRAYQSPSCLGEAFQHVLSRSKRQLITLSTVADAPGSISLRNFSWGETINHTLTGVPGATEIKVWLRILNSLHASPMGPTVKLKTLEGTPGPVSELRAVVVGINRVNISWNPPTEPNGVITGYDFEAHEIKGLDIALSSRYPTVHDGSLTGYEMTALRANTSYRLVVLPRTSAGLGIDSFIDITTLDVTSTPTAPTFFIADITETSFNITYEPSHRGEPGSVFFAQYRIPGIILWQESLRVFLSRTIHVAGLLPSTTYEVRMVATNGAFISTPSPPKIITTSGPAPPGGLEGASATWFAIVIILLIIIIFVFVLLICIRVQRFKEVQEKAAPTEPLFEPPTMFPEPQSLLSVEQEPLNPTIPYGSMGLPQPLGEFAPPRSEGSHQDHFERPYYPNQPISDSEMSWSPNEDRAAEVIELSDFSTTSPVGRVGHYAPRSIGSASANSGSGADEGQRRRRSSRPGQGRSVENRPTII
ncbi:Neuroglian [Echinococcus granulosus]|uniref:Neuroglian n=2 Tax=Echinococcus granulosus TaxID=6210 RepID=W6UDX7_ECHGR|nr:Neuroglian [Echinococcus granulosus]EUB59051.1 Neuroglian [Echinococcus granulosus]